VTDREQNEKERDAEGDRIPIKNPDDETSEIMETASINKAEPNTYIGLSDLIPPKRNVNRDDVEQAQARLAAGIAAAKAKDEPHGN
jgi:hypothetical protein